MARSPGPDRVEQRVNLLSLLRPIMGPQPGNGDPIPDNNGDRSGEYDHMEKWLDSHPEFSHDYFARKATRSMIDGWYIARAVSQTTKPPVAESPHSPSSSSGSNTPVRKVSASEFEVQGSGGSLGRMISTVDGAPSFLGTSHLHLQGNSRSSPTRSRKSISELKQLDDRAVLMELVKDIANDLDLNSLCHKILQNVLILTKADRGSLFLVYGKGTEQCYLGSKLFDVTSESTVEVAGKEEVRVSWGKGIIGYVAKTGEAVNIANAYEDPRFNCEIDLQTGYKTRSMLSMPIKAPLGEVIGVAQVINKIGSKDRHEAFTDSDEKVFAQYLQFCGIGINNARIYERATMEIRRNQVLLELAKVLFEEQSTLSNIVRRIMELTISLLRCERCSILLVDETSKHIFSKVFELGVDDLENKGPYNGTSKECRFPIHLGITGYTATTGETLNIADVYKDSRFDPKIDEETGYKTRQMLSMPIKNAYGSILGVILLVNKQDGTPFNMNDEDMFEAFSIFCGMGINNTYMYEKVCRSVAKQRVALETLSYHATAPQEEAVRLKKMAVPTLSEIGLDSYFFSDMKLSEDETLTASLRMFIDLDLINRFHINYETLCRWLLSVRKNYRNVRYHNWRHAFTVTQTMYSILKNGGMHGILSDLECLALLVGCLSHDLDHRGTTNNYQIMSESPLAQLYSTSTMEHHHFDQCIMIIHSKGNEIFLNLTAEEYSHAMRILEHAILATDLALYFKYRGEFFSLVEEGHYDWSDDDHKDLLRGMMMTASDVSAITKPWDVQKKVAHLIFGEFFEQGDLERQNFNKTPEDMMNREKLHLLPKMQVGFVDSICMPVYEALSKTSEKMTPLLLGCKANRDHWQDIAEQCKQPMVEVKEQASSEEKDIDESEALQTSNQSSNKE
ncbi:dual 3',5'-cyclic-AMP and -GMP phosphodiesterase 11-like isoform X2 [Asterias rubens]|uniref:dual 3',5'-cyclic-AMP and -GMP phosphodiesterase 11-like isoform X2 n=1 Tax=Asterias rubens TaxID=7604 RepID=UPI00145531CA|nr:dual 3',5'-cyclic-AMP and -GMP phosphodiesterase 11-like isoform X2 [Asterias rubens]